MSELLNALEASGEPRTSQSELTPPNYCVERRNHSAVNHVYIIWYIVNTLWMTTTFMTSERVIYCCDSFIYMICYCNPKHILYIECDTEITRLTQLRKFKSSLIISKTIDITCIIDFHIYTYMHILMLVYDINHFDTRNINPVTRFQLWLAGWSRVFSWEWIRHSWTLQWRHNDHGGVSNHRPRGCLLNCLFRRRSKKTSKLRVTGLCAGNSPRPVNSPHKGPVMRKMVPFDDVIMIYSGGQRTQLARLIQYLLYICIHMISCNINHFHSEKH